MSWRTAASILDAEIEELQTRLQELRARRNSITPLYQLPDEIIARILLMAQLDLGPNDARLSVSFIEVWTEPGLRKPGWVTSMLVCRRFREVALSSAVLWASLDLEHRKNCDWAHLCRERALECALDLNGVMESSETEATDLTLDYLGNARRARVVILAPEIQAYHDVSTRLVCCLSEPRPLLEDLEIVNIGNYRFYPSWEPPPIVILNPTLLGGTNINLTSLDLTNVDWTEAPPMPLLKFLTLNKFDIDESCLNVQALLRQTPAVSRMTMLYPRLRFDMNTPHNYTFPNQQHDVGNWLSLPELVSLTLSGSLPLLVWLLRVLPNPKDYFHIITTPSEDREEHVTWLSSLDERFSAYVVTRLGTFMSGLVHLRTSVPSSATMFAYHSEAIELHFGPDDSDTYPQNCAARCDLIILSSAAVLSQLMQYARRLTVPNAEDLPGLSLILRPFLHLALLSVGSVSPIRMISNEADEQTLIQQKECLEKMIQTQASAQRYPIPRLVLHYHPDDDIPDRGLREAVAAQWKQAEWVKDVEWVQRL